MLTHSPRHRLAVQKKANCIIGTDYPHPILDEKTEKANCQARIKAAFAVSSLCTSQLSRGVKADFRIGQAARQLEGSARWDC